MKAKQKDLDYYDSISSYMQERGLPSPQHPLIGLADYFKHNIAYPEHNRGAVVNFYKISFRDSSGGKLKYGMGYYDFKEGGLGFSAPGQILNINEIPRDHKGYTLFFHPDLLRNSSLAKKINGFGFFSYAVSEGLNLSEKERDMITSLFKLIQYELDMNIDHVTEDIFITYVEQILNYSKRFYNRQFLTRKKVYTDLIADMEIYLKDFFNKEEALTKGLPSVQQLANHLQVSPRYLSDMLKSLTGQTTQQYIHNALIEKAKNILSTEGLTISQVAYQLGFEHSQSFNRLFKQKTGVTPLQYRQRFN